MLTPDRGNGVEALGYRFGKQGKKLSAWLGSIYRVCGIFGPMVDVRSACFKTRWTEFGKSGAVSM